MPDDLKQALHAIWCHVLADKKVKPHEVVIEGMRRAYSLGCDVGVREERDRCDHQI